MDRSGNGFPRWFGLITGLRPSRDGCYRFGMGRFSWILIVVGCLALSPVSGGEREASPQTATPVADDPPVAGFRIESEIFSGDGDEPIARSLTIFSDGVAWDFLNSTRASAGADRGDDVQGVEEGEIVLHDPRRKRIVLIDPGRNVRTEIESVTLDRLAASLEAWSRTADEPTVRWAGGADLAASIEQKDDHSLVIDGPRIRYEVAYETAPSTAAAETYRRFADTAILLKALVQPGGLPPFPRMAINRRIAATAAIPVEVTLRVGGGQGGLGFSTATLRSTHRVHPRVLDEDRARIESAMAHLAVSKSVILATYIEDEESGSSARKEGTTRTGGATDSPQKE